MKLFNVSRALISNLFYSRYDPQHIIWHSTWNCNLSCEFCTVSTERSSGRSKELTARQMIDFLSTLPSISFLRITGGEPFLRSDLYEVVNWFTSRGGNVYINSNGVLLENISEQVSKLKYPSNVTVKISIDGFDKRHDSIRGMKGAFKKGVECVKFLQSSKLRKVEVQSTLIGRKDFLEFSKLRTYFARLGINVYPGIARNNSNAIYSDSYENSSDEDIEGLSLSSFDNLTKRDFELYFSLLDGYIDREKDYERKMTTVYFLAGLRNRILKGIRSPETKCLASVNLLRILPDGTIPICTYFASSIGKVGKDDYGCIVVSANLKKARRITNSCKGCWLNCETIPSSVFSWSLIKFYLTRPWNFLKLF